MSDARPGEAAQAFRRESFRKKQRLLNSTEFQAVFKTARLKVSSRTLLVLATENQLPYARIGLVVGKRHVKLAAQRNRVKRIIRESFRQMQHDLVGMDIIVLIRAGGLSEQDNTLIRESIDTLWQDLIRRKRGKQQKPGKVQHAG